MDENIVEIITVAVFFISLYGLITSKNIIKSIVFVVLMETTVIMFFLGIGYSAGIFSPIGADIYTHVVADPLPQAFMITAVVIGLCGTAVNIVLFISLYRKFSTSDWETARISEITEKSKC